MGLIGKADVVEFHLDEEKQVQRIVPVEYKRGRPKKDDSDRVQLCAQALCLEEMCGTEVTEGALFYGTKRRRLVVEINDSLRQTTRQASQEFRNMIESQTTPPAVLKKACKKCSLIDLCMPSISDGNRSVARFLSRQIQNHLDASDPTTDRE